MIPFVIAPIQIAFVLINKSIELQIYYRRILDQLKDIYRCQLYNRFSQVGKNIAQADQDGCPLKIILGTEELKQKKVVLIRRDKTEEKFSIFLESENVDQDIQVTIENLVPQILANKKIVLHREKFGEQLVQKIKEQMQKEKFCQAIAEFAYSYQQNLYQRSINFRDNHIFFVENYSELKKKIKSDFCGLFLVPFCNQLECEKTLDSKVPTYSIRCISDRHKIPTQCLFCLLPATTMVYLGRSY